MILTQPPWFPKKGGQKPSGKLQKVSPRAPLPNRQPQGDPERYPKKGEMVPQKLRDRTRLKRSGKSKNKGYAKEIKREKTPLQMEKRGKDNKLNQIAG